MPTYRPYALNTGSTIGQTIQFGDIAIGTNGTLDFSSNPGDVKWWMGPDEESGYVITCPDLNYGQSTPTGVNAGLRFWRSAELTDESFISVANVVARRYGSSTFTGTTQAMTWLGLSGFPTSYFIGDSLCSEYQDVYDTMENKPTGLDLYTQNWLAKNLVSSGLWNVLDVVRFYGTHTNNNQEAQLDWKNPMIDGDIYYQSDFSAGTDDFLVYLNVSIIGNQDGVTDGNITYDDCFKQTIVTAGSSPRSVRYGVFTTGIRSKLTADIYVPSGQSITYVRFYSGDVLQLLGQTNVIGSWHSITFCSHAAYTQLQITSNNAAVNNYFYVRNIKVQEWTSAIAFNTPIHTARQGFQFNGTTNYLLQNWIPAYGAWNYQQDSASQILYIRDSLSNSGSKYHGVGTNSVGSDCLILPKYSNLSYIRNNNKTSNNNANTTAPGFYINTRVASNNIKLYKNGTAIISANTLSTGVINTSPCTGAANYDYCIVGHHIQDQVFFEAWGGGLDQTQVNNLTDIVNCAAILLGVNVF